MYVVFVDYEIYEKCCMSSVVIINSFYIMW